MTRKNYVAIAQIVKHIMGESHLTIPLVNTLSNYFKDENDKFSPYLFKTACLNGAAKKESEVIPLKKENLPVKAPIHHETTPIVTNTKRVDDVLAGADEAMSKNLERLKSEASCCRKKKKT